MATSVPQPAPERLTQFAKAAIVVGIVPGIPDLVALAARSLAEATGATRVHFAYCDPSRIVVRENADGSVVHAPLSPDNFSENWKECAQELEEHLEGCWQEPGPPWTFHYLAGRPDRALTHLARAVDASVIVVGARARPSERSFREFFEGSVALHLMRHQHRPVLSVPLTVVDWKESRTAWDR